MTIKIILGLLIVGLALVTSACAFNNKSKAPSTVGNTSKQFSACPSSPNCVSSQASGSDHFIEPLHFSGNSEKAWQQIQTIISALPKAQIVEVDANYLHAQFTSSLLRFVDDVELILDEDKKVIHLRSASRVGYSDFGQNRKRGERLRGLFSQEQ